MSGIELLTTDGDTLADHARVAAAWSVLATVAKDQYDALRNGPVSEKIRALAEDAGGGGFTARPPGVGQVILTDPEPSARVTDPEAFAGWLGKSHSTWVEWRRRLELSDADRALELRDLIGSGVSGIPRGEAVTEFFAECVRVVEVPYFPDDAIDRLITGGDAVIRQDDEDEWGLFAVYQGSIEERIPGTDASKGRKQVQLRADSGAKAEFAGQLRAALGAGGDA